MVFIYHRLKKPSIFDFESVPAQVRKLIYWAKRKWFPNFDYTKIKECDRPVVKTSTIPGPKGKGVLNDIAIFSLDFYNNRVFAHPEKSYLNYFADADDNMILDLNIKGLPLGYNNPLFIKNSFNEENLLAASNPSLDSSEVFSESSLLLLEKLQKELSVGNLTKLYPTDLIDDSLNSLVSMNKNFHRNNEKKSVIATIGKDITLPDLNLNETQDEYFSRAASDVLRSLDENKDKLLGVVLSPILSSKQGHLYPTSSFAREINDYCKNNYIAVIVDETRSYINSGLVYGFDYWKLPNEPDFVVLRNESNCNPLILTNSFNARYVNLLENKKFYTKNLNNSLGLLKYVKEENVLNQVAENERYVLNQLSECQKYNKDKLLNLRGKGTYTSFDLPTREIRNNFQAQVLNSGINLCSVGEKSITMRSTLVFKKNFLDYVKTSINNFSI